MPHLLAGDTRQQRLRGGGVAGASLIDPNVHTSLGGPTEPIQCRNVGVQGPCSRLASCSLFTGHGGMVTATTLNGASPSSARNWKVVPRGIVRQVPGRSSTHVGSWSLCRRHIWPVPPKLPDIPARWRGRRLLLFALFKLEVSEAAEPGYLAHWSDYGSVWGCDLRGIFQ